MAAGAVALAIMLALIAARSSTPSYAGRSAESWLCDVFDAPRGPTTQSDDIAAFREMGAKGISFLVDSLGRQDHALRRLYRRILAKLPLALRRRMPRPVDADTLANAASLMLLNVRDNAPQRTFQRLVRLLSSGNPRTRLHAAVTMQYYTLNYPQLDCVRFRPQLIRALDDGNDWVRIKIATMLDTVGLGGPELLSALRPGLTNSDPMVRNAAQSTLDRLMATKAAPVQSHAP